MAGPYEIGRAAVVVGQRPHRVAALLGRNSRSQSVADIDGYRKRRAERGLILRNHRIQVQTTCLLGTERRAHNSRGVSDDEGHLIGRAVRGRNEEIAFIFAVIVVGHDDDFALGEGLDRDFDAVIEGCAEPKQDRVRTWINIRIRRIYRSLFDRGHCHTVEVYDGDHLVGGLYGVSLGRAFFGESMFHRARDASKIALAHLVARLKAGGYILLDTQYVTEHLKTFGAVEVPKRRYHRLLEEALHGNGDFTALTTTRPVSGNEVLSILRDNK